MLVTGTGRSGGDSLKAGRTGGGQQLGRCGAHGKDLGDQKKCRSLGRQSEAPGTLGSGLWAPGGQSTGMSVPLCPVSCPASSPEQVLQSGLLEQWTK